MALYAAYGSNLDPRQMASAPRTRRRAAPAGSTAGGSPSAARTSAGRAPSRPSSRSRSPGLRVLYDCRPADEAALDQWEGSDIGLYRKIRVRVHTLDGERHRLALRARRLRGRPARRPLPRHHRRRRRGRPARPTTTSPTCATGPAGPPASDEHRDRGAHQPRLSAGLTGCGKRTTAHALARKTGAVVLDNQIINLPVMTAVDWTVDAGSPPRSGSSRR